MEQIFNPHPYQYYCINRMINEKHLGLLLNMGLGKTAITLTALNELIFYKREINRVLIIAPKKVAESTWDSEASKWVHLSHLRISKILGTQKQRLKAANEDAYIYIINRENVSWLVDNFKTNWKWDCLIIDELTSFKNHQAKRFKKLKQILPQVNRVYGLTGTPAANGLIDLWAQMYLLDQGKRLGKTIGAYRNKYFKPDKRNAYTIFTYKLLPGAEHQIRERISDICISLKSDDYVKLPDLIKANMRINLSSKVMEQYQEMEKEMLLNLPDGEISAVNAATVTTKLLQIASGAVYDEDGNVHQIHQDKLDALKEIIEAAGDESVLVFYNFKHERDLILEKIAGAKEFKDDNDLRAWNAGKIKVLVAHPASCGYGLNIQDGGHNIVWFSPTWNLEQYEQANARLHRQGQQQPVVVQHILAKNTVDEQVMAALASKDKTQDALLKALQEKLKELRK